MIGAKFYTEVEKKVEAKPTSTNKSKSNFGRYVIVFIAVIFIFGALIQNSATTNVGNYNSDIEGILEYMKYYEESSDVKVFSHKYGVKIIDSASRDSEGLLGVKNQYLAKIIVNAWIGPAHDDEAFSIEIFNDTEDLEARVKYIETKNKYLDEVYGDQYGMFLPGMAKLLDEDSSTKDLPMKKEIYKSGRALLCINEHIADDWQSEIYHNFKKAVNKVGYEKANNVNQEKVAQISKDNEMFLKAWKEKYAQEKLINAIEDLKDEMVKQVNCSYAIGNQELIDKTLEDIEPFDTKKYQNEYQEWKKLLTAAKKSVAKGEVSKEMLAKQEEYKKTVYPEGKYVVGKDIMPGIYQVIANDEADKSSVYIDYKCSYEVYGNTYINITDVKDNRGYYNEISITGATMYHIDNAPKLEFKIPGVYKVGRDIEAGEYLVQADAYSKYYVATDPKYLNKENILEMKKSLKKQYLKDEPNYGYLEAEPDEQTITFKDGEYLYITNEEIRIRKK